MCLVDLLNERFDSNPPIDLAGNHPQMDLSEEPPDLAELVKLVTAAVAMQASRTGYVMWEEWEGQWGRVGGAVE